MTKKFGRTRVVSHDRKKNIYFADVKNSKNTAVYTTGKPLIDFLEHELTYTDNLEAIFGSQLSQKWEAGTNIFESSGFITEWDDTVQNFAALPSAGEEPTGSLDGLKRLCPKGLDGGGANIGYLESEAIMPTSFHDGTGGTFFGVFNSTDNTGTAKTLFCNKNTSPSTVGAQVTLIPSTNQNILRLTNGTGTYVTNQAFGSSFLCDGEWHSLIIRHKTDFDGTNDVEIWVDGVLERHPYTTSTPNLSASSDVLEIGCYRLTTATQNLNGEIALFCFADTFGTDDQIKRAQHYLDRIVQGLNFTRDSEASYFNGKQIDWNNTDEIRLEDRGDGYGPMFLLEGSGSNLIDYSEDFSNWSSAGSVSASNSLTAFDGTNDAWRLYDTGSSYASFTGNTTTQDLGIYNQFIYILKDNEVGRYPCFQINGNTPISGGSAGININTKTGAITTRVGAPFSSGSLLVGDWWLVDITYEVTTSGNTTTVIYPAVNDSSHVFNFQFAAATGSIDTWGIQRSPLSFPQSYIRTTGASAVRQPDKLITSDFPGTMSTGSWYLDVSPFFNSTESDFVTDGGGTSKYIWYFDTASNAKFTGTPGQISVSISGNITTISNAEWNRHQVMRFGFDLPNGFFSIQGLTKGNQRFDLSGSTVLPTSSMYWGSDNTNKANYYGRISEPQEMEMLDSWEPGSALSITASSFPGNKDQSFWFACVFYSNLYPAGTDYPILVGDWSENGWAIFQSSYFVRFRLVDDTVSINTTPGANTVYDEGAWNAFIGWYDATGSTINISVNNGAVSSTAVPSYRIPSGSANAIIGAFTAGGSNRLDGGIHCIMGGNNIVPSEAQRISFFNEAVKAGCGEFGNANNANNILADNKWVATNLTAVAGSGSILTDNGINTSQHERFFAWRVTGSLL